MTSLALMPTNSRRTSTVPAEDRGAQRIEYDRVGTHMRSRRVCLFAAGYAQATNGVCELGHECTRQHSHSLHVRSRIYLLDICHTAHADHASTSVHIHKHTKHTPHCSKHSTAANTHTVPRAAARTCRQLRRQRQWHRHPLHCLCKLHTEPHHLQLAVGFRQRLSRKVLHGVAAAKPRHAGCTGCC